MSVDKLVDSSQLDTDLTSVATAIRTKGGTSAQLSFPNGFVSAINDIQSQSAYIVVESSAGALLTCGTQTYQLGESETLHAFLIDSLGTYTITATKQGITSSATQVVFSLTVYYVSIKVARIPNQYQEVEYIESTGSQYVNTGYVPTNQDLIEFKFMVNAYDNQAVFGSRSDGTYLTSRSQLFLNIKNIEREVVMFFGPNDFKLFDLTLYKINDANFTIRGVQDATESTFAFALNNIGTPTAFFIGRIYKLKVADKIELVPCYRKSDNIAGMYDLVNETFLTNLGTGSFIVGGDV